MRVIGLDPGLQRTGWGVVDVAGSRLSHVANGVCLSGDGDLPVRLARLHAEIGRVVPASELARLREVTLWMSLPYPGTRPKAEYHPDPGW